MTSALLTGLRKAWPQALVLALVLAATLDQDSHAFTVILPNDAFTATPLEPHEYPIFQHWDLRRLALGRLPFSRCRWGGTADIPGNGEEAAISAAITTWNYITSSELSTFEVPDGRGLGGNCAYSKDNWNLIYFENSAPKIAAAGYNPGQPPDGNGNITVGISGFTWVAFDNHGRLLEADVALNNTTNKGFTWVIAADQAAVNWPDNFGWGLVAQRAYQADLQTIATHEIGHVLGLHHDTVTGSIMHLFGFFGWNGFAKHSLGNDDKNGIRFLYTPDMGDAPDPFMQTMGYPTDVMESPYVDTLSAVRLNGIFMDIGKLGAQHIFGKSPVDLSDNWNYEWLGASPSANVDGEVTYHQTGDEYDDGVTLTPRPVLWNRVAEVSVHMRYATDGEGNMHDYETSGLHANVWLDFEQDGMWEGNKIVGVSVVPDSLTGPNQTGVVVHRESLFLPAGSKNTPMWMRARIDYGEDAGQRRPIDDLNEMRGAAQFGEVEDYLLRYTHKNKHTWIPNLSGDVMRSLELAYVGEASGSFTLGTMVYGSPPEPLEDLPAEALTEGYAPGSDETIINVNSLFGPIFPGEGVGLVRAQPDTIPLGHLRARWIPEVPIPGEDYRIPTTHSGLELGSEGMTLLVGCINDGNGGYGGTREVTTGAWLDSMHVSVSYRLADFEVPPDQLRPSDPYIASLPQVFGGAGWINPEEPLEVFIPWPASAMIEGVTSSTNVIAEITTS